MRVKTVFYAYPTSEFAVDLGFDSTGCYAIAVHQNHKPTALKDIVFACLTKDEVFKAVACVEFEDIPFSKYSLPEGN